MLTVREDAKRVGVPSLRWASPVVGENMEVGRVVVLEVHGDQAVVQSNENGHTAAGGLQPSITR
jgi:hypothetical protein